MLNLLRAPVPKAWSIVLLVCVELLLEKLCQIAGVAVELKEATMVLGPGKCRHKVLALCVTMYIIDQEHRHEQRYEITTHQGPLALWAYSHMHASRSFMTGCAITVMIRVSNALPRSTSF